MAEPLLENNGSENPFTLTPQRSVIRSIIALAKGNLESLFVSLINRETVSVNVKNKNDYRKQFQHLSFQLDRFSSFVNNFPFIWKRNGQMLQTHISTENMRSISSLTIKLDEIISAVEQAKYNPPSTDPLQSVLEKQITGLLGKLEEVKKTIVATKFVPVKSQKVEGKVAVENMPSFEGILKQLSRIEEAVRSFKVEIPRQETVKIPPFPKTIQMENKEIIKSLGQLREEINELPLRMPQMEFPNEINVGNFPPQKYPLPVTNININPLRGYAKSRGITVTSDLTLLPDEVLAYRRSIIIYNNSNQNVYIGGQDTTSSNGLIITPGTFSPTMDAGPKMIIYGVVSSGTADVRTFEMSNENIGG